MSRKNSAGSSITDLVGVVPHSALYGGEAPMWHFPELAASTLTLGKCLAGEMVCLSGTVGGAVGLTRPNTDSSGYGIVGFMADDGAGTASSFKGVYIATPDVVFVGNVGHATSASAQTAATDLGQRYGLTSLSGRTYVDKGKTSVSTTMCRVIGLHDQDDHPCFYGKVYFQVLSNSCQLTNGWNTNSSSNSELVI